MSKIRKAITTGVIATVIATSVFASTPASAWGRGWGGGWGRGWGGGGGAPGWGGGWRWWLGTPRLGLWCWLGLSGLGLRRWLGLWWLWLRCRDSGCGTWCSRDWSDCSQRRSTEPILLRLRLSADPVRLWFCQRPPLQKGPFLHGMGLHARLCACALPVNSTAAL